MLKNQFEFSPPKKNEPIPELATVRPTGEAYSASFESTAANEDLAANDPLYDRRQKAKTAPIPKEQPESTSRGSVYTKIALTEENGLEKAIMQWRHDKAEAFLIDMGILTKNESGIFVLTTSGKEKLLKKGWTGWDESGKKDYATTWSFGEKIRQKYNLPSSQKSVKLVAEDFFSYLEKCSAIDAEHPDQPPLPITKIPGSLQEVLDGKFSGVHLKPWEIPVGTTSWTTPVTLSDGSVSNMAEIAVADALKKMNASRNDQGVLFVDNSETNKRVPLTARMLRRYIPNIDSLNSGLLGRPSEFAQKHLSELARLGVLSANDFRSMSGQFNEGSVVAPSDRKISSTHASLVTPGGKSLKYYLGRSKIVGTDIPLDPSNTVIRYLDQTTCAFVQNKGGNEEILATFPLFTPEEVEARRDETRKRLEETGHIVSEQDLAGRTSMNGPEMEGRVHPYRVTDFAQQLPGEDSKAYADRIAKLSDTRLVSKTTREFFQQHSIGLHRLPWTEQLAASSILLDPRFQKEQVGTFCKRYGIDGLRTFISSTYGKNINRDIIALGEKAPELAERTFKKYSEVLAVVDEAESSLRSFGIAEKLDADKREQSIRDIKNQLTQRAKSVLEKIATSVQQTKHLTKNDLATLEAELSQSQADTLLYLNTFKVLKENGVIQSLSEAEKFQPEMLRGGEITPALQQQMLDLYDKNYPLGKKYSKQFRAKILANLKEAFNNPNSVFHIVTRDGQLDAYLRFDRQGTDATGREQIYFGSFNVGPKGARVGETFLDECLKQESSDAVISASADPTLPISSHYIEKNGFVATSVEMLADKPLLKIKRDASLNERLITKGTVSLVNDPAIRERVKSGEVVHTRGQSGEMPDFSPLEQGFILTRFIISKDGTTTCIFENLPQSSDAA